MINCFLNFAVNLNMRRYGQAGGPSGDAATTLAPNAAPYPLVWASAVVGLCTLTLL